MVENLATQSKDANAVAGVLDLVGDMRRHLRPPETPESPGPVTEKAALTMRKELDIALRMVETLSDQEFRSTEEMEDVSSLIGVVQSQADEAIKTVEMQAMMEADRRKQDAVREEERKKEEAFREEEQKKVDAVLEEEQKKEDTILKEEVDQLCERVQRKGTERQAKERKDKADRAMLNLLEKEQNIVLIRSCLESLVLSRVKDVAESALKEEELGIENQKDEAASHFLQVNHSFLSLLIVISNPNHSGSLLGGFEQTG